jgi:hypothetical protein
MVEEFGICETLKMARPDDVEFRDVAVPLTGRGPGGPWRACTQGRVGLALEGAAGSAVRTESTSG